jgi:prevent-host-death family protein
MRYVSATEAKQALAAVLDAAQREPVVIRRQQREVAVILSMQEYERLTALNIEEFQRFCDRIGEQAKERGLTEEKLSELLVSDS